MGGSNGHSPIEARAEAHAAHAKTEVGRHVTDLQRLLAQEDQVQSDLGVLLSESKERQSGLRKAIEALAPGTLEPRRAGRPGRAPGRPATSTGPRAAGALNYVRPNDESLERVLRDLVRHDPNGEGLTVDGMLEAIGGNGHGISRDTIRRAFYALRDDGHARKAGVTEKGGTLYAAMPEEIERLQAAVS